MPSNPTLFQKIRRIFTLRTILIIVWLITIISLILYRRYLDDSALASLSGLPLGVLSPLEVPWWYRWVGADQLAFMTVLVMWFFSWGFRKVPVMQGVALTFGLVLLIVMLSWLIHRTDQLLLLILFLSSLFFLYLRQVPLIIAILFSLALLLVIGLPHWLVYDNLPRVSEEEFDVAKHQAVLRMSRENWADNNYLQPYDCDPYDATAPAFNSNLAYISNSLHVNIVRCETSSWKEPGGILIWKDMFGTHTHFIFGAPWKVFQEYYMTLGLPTSQPYMASNNRIAQDFGIAMRIMYEPKKDDDKAKVAWIQQRYPTLLNFLPNIFCIEILHTPNNESCWQPMEAEGSSVSYSQQSMPTPYPEDWLENAGYDIPLGGWWAPLNPWKALFMAELMLLSFIMLIAFRQSLSTMWSQFGCMGKLVMFLLILGLAFFVILLASTYLYSSPNNILNDLQLPKRADLNFKEGFNPLNPMQQLSKFMVTWFEQLIILLKKPNTVAVIWVLRALWITFGLVMGLLLIPMWIGLVIGGPMGGWIGLFVLIGMMMAVGSFAPLKRMGSFSGQWVE
jgi:hypothetical protein